TDRFGARGPSPGSRKRDPTSPLRGEVKLRAGELEGFAAQIAAQRLEGLDDNCFGIESGLGIHGGRGILINENVREHHGAHLEAPVEHAALRERVEDVRAEAADCALLDGDEHFMLTREPKEEVSIQWLCEAR